MRCHLDYADIIYDKPKYESSKNKRENVQHRTSLTITVTQGTSQERLYHELGLESLSHRG